MPPRRPPTVVRRSSLLLIALQENLQVPSRKLARAIATALSRPIANYCEDRRCSHPPLKLDSKFPPADHLVRWKKAHSFESCIASGFCCLAKFRTGIQARRAGCPRKLVSVRFDGDKLPCLPQTWLVEDPATRNRQLFWLGRFFSLGPRLCRGAGKSGFPFVIRNPRSFCGLSRRTTLDQSIATVPIRVVELDVQVTLLELDDLAC